MAKTGINPLEAQKFTAWYEIASKACESICGLSLDDIEDGPSYDSWEAGMSPASYARKMIRQSGGKNLC